MKRFFVITYLACFGIFNSTIASVVFPSASIALKGMLSVGGPMRSLPVEANLYAVSVEVIFNADLGNLTIEVVNETGDTVFKSTVNAIADGTLAIDTTILESGEYILLIMDDQEGYLEGSFLID